MGTTAVFQLCCKTTEVDGQSQGLQRKCQARLCLFAGLHFFECSVLACKHPSPGKDLIAEPPRFTMDLSSAPSSVCRALGGGLV